MSDTQSTSFFFFFNDTATTEIYTLSLHDALPIYVSPPAGVVPGPGSGASTAGNHRSELAETPLLPGLAQAATDRKSTRLNSSHVRISYAVFCLKKTTYTLIVRYRPVRRCERITSY